MATCLVTFDLWLPDLWIWTSSPWQSWRKESCPSLSFSWSSSWECLRPRHSRHPCRSLRKEKRAHVCEGVVMRFSELLLQTAWISTFLLLWSALHFLFGLFLFVWLIFVFLEFLFLHLLSICETTWAKAGPWRLSRHSLIIFRFFSRISFLTLNGRTVLLRCVFILLAL